MTDYCAVIKEKIEEYKKATEKLHSDIHSSNEIKGEELGAFSEQHFLLALSALEQAKSHFQLAAYFAALGD